MPSIVAAGHGREGLTVGRMQLSEIHLTHTFFFNNTKKNNKPFVDFNCNCTLAFQKVIYVIFIRCDTAPATDTTGSSLPMVVG